MDFAEGGCLCRANRYRVRGPALSSVLCHCERCRRAAGAPVVAWVTFARTDIEILSGSAARYASSPGVLRRFCGNCGTALTYETEAEPDSIDVTTASLDQPSLFPPSHDEWLEESPFPSR